MRRQIAFCWQPFGTQSKPVVDLEVVLCKPEFADSDIVNAEDLAGKVAVVRRGRTSFKKKAERVIRAGAVGLVLVNDEDDLFEAEAHEDEDEDEDKDEEDDEENAGNDEDEDEEDEYLAGIPVMMIKTTDEAGLLAVGDTSCLYNPCLMTLRGHE